MLRRAWIVWIACSSAGCYQPRPERDCEVRCIRNESNPSAGCPPGFLCGPSNLCTVSGGACTGDAGVDGDVVDAPDAVSFCFGTGIARPCVPTVAAGTLQLSGPINTDTDGRCVGVDQPIAGPQLCVMASEAISITGPVHAVGTRPLVLAASGTINVGQPLDARSVRAELATGAGASPCPAVNGPTGTQTSNGMRVGSGGAGGSFQGMGGNGGGGGGGTTASAAARPAVAFPDHVRGGCPGGSGGQGSTSILGKAGAGGGVIYLIASQIAVTSTIAVTGAGAHLRSPDHGSDPRGGGGGGGSGGLIVLDAPTVMLASTARLLALGGGAAAGGPALSEGVHGNDPALMAPMPSGMTAAGGQGTGGAGSGGAGSTNLVVQATAGVPGATDTGGGGGGGASGYIKLLCTTCTTDPAAIVIPPRTLP